MKTEFKDTLETTLTDEIKGTRTTSDESVASRGNVKETFKKYNEHVEEHFYDKKEIDYFFSKIWHWVKKHVLKVDFYTDLLGNLQNSLSSDPNYEKLSKKAISVESVQSLGNAVTERIRYLESENTSKDEQLNKLLSRIKTLEEYVAKHDEEFKKHLEDFENHKDNYGYYNYYDYEYSDYPTGLKNKEGQK